MPRTLATQERFQKEFAGKGRASKEVVDTIWSELVGHRWNPHPTPPQSWAMFVKFNQEGEAIQEEFYTWLWHLL